jgi:TetR/AcrR family transcriptional repressor of lmrAB and yxaGH operons
MKSSTQNLKTKKTKGEATREKLVAVAADLFHARGYHAVGLNEICKAGDLPKGSVYYHFPKGKEEIAIAVIEASREQIGVQLVAARTATANIEDFIDLTLAQFADNLLQSDFQKGCPITTINLEMASASEPIRKACAEAFAHWIDLSAAALSDRDQKTAKAIAQTLFLAIEGGLILARAQRSTAPLNDLADHLKKIAA